MRSALSILFSILACLAPACGAGRGDGDWGPARSRAYKGHTDDRDMRNLVEACPEIAGSRVDDCRTCHAGGEVVLRGRKVRKGSCDYCHCVPFPEEPASGSPTTYAETLNAFGIAYRDAGRTAEAVRAVAALDSDGDGHANGVELGERRFPGNPASRPGLPAVPTRALRLAELRRLPAHSQLLLVNAHTQRNDYYGVYEGVPIRDLLAAVGAEPAGMSGVTVFSADGYRKDFDREAVLGPGPPGVFFSGLDAASLGAERGFVDYPRSLPPGLVDGGRIPGEQWLMLAWARDGAALDPARLDARTGRLLGEGPLRLVVPQAEPGPPDRGSACSPSGFDDGYDYDDAKDHNAGRMVRGVVALRVNPVPEGYEEFDHMEEGWKCLKEGRLVIYGSGVE